MKTLIEEIREILTEVRSPQSMHSDLKKNIEKEFDSAKGTPAGKGAIKFFKKTLKVDMVVDASIARKYWEDGTPMTNSVSDRTKPTGIDRSFGKSDNLFF